MLLIKSMSDSTYLSQECVLSSCQMNTQIVLASSSLSALSYALCVIARALCVTIHEKFLAFVLSVWCHSCVWCLFITGGIQRHLQLIGVEVSTHQSILCDFYVFMCFIRAWYDTHIVVSCKVLVYI